MKTRNTIYIIGAGGVGSWLLPSICLLEAPERVVVVDGDSLELKNLSRQLFTEQDLGSNKAMALAGRYGCSHREEWFSAGVLDIRPNDWLLVCVDNHRARREALIQCDISRCSAILSANETHSAEAFVYFHGWKRTRLDPRVYYPEIATSTENDPRAASIGCTGEAQQNNPQLVSANFMAAALAQHLYVLWAMEHPRMEDRDSIVPMLPFHLKANLSRLEQKLVGTEPL